MFFSFALNCSTDPKWGSFSSEGCIGKAFLAPEAQRSGIYKREYIDGDLIIKANVGINCGRQIESGNVEKKGNSIKLSIETSGEGNRCGSCIHPVEFTLNNMEEKDYTYIWGRFHYEDKKFNEEGFYVGEPTFKKD